MKNNNLAEEARRKTIEAIRAQVKVRCKKCNGVMIQVYDIWDQETIGYSCKGCPHYYLFE
jgi:hypothetical protein